MYYSTLWQFKKCRCTDVKRLKNIAFKTCIFKLNFIIYYLFIYFSRFYDELLEKDLLVPLGQKIENFRKLSESKMNFIAPGGAESLVQHFFNKAGNTLFIINLFSIFYLLQVKKFIVCILIYFQLQYSVFFLNPYFWTLLRFKIHKLWVKKFDCLMMPHFQSVKINKLWKILSKYTMSNFM